ncbi:uncharacterized protein BDW70DRAFT_143126 [Aspergillus foveolatus]|uniref:uncharacterized protein n=1 Tax=Aspergillus foveolatus TaxID=210207 RepID=UPI003CCD645A
MPDGWHHNQPRTLIESGSSFEATVLATGRDPRARPCALSSAAFGGRSSILGKPQADPPCGWEKFTMLARTMIGILEIFAEAPGHSLALALR